MSWTTEIDIRARDRRITALKGVIDRSLHDAATWLRENAPTKDKVFYSHGNPSVQVSVGASRHAFDNIDPEVLREQMAVEVELLIALALNKADRFNAQTFYCFNQANDQIRVVITTTFMTEF